MRVVETVAQMRDLHREWDGARVGFVPTMGYLHAGHLSLVVAARAECERVVASIFVNPTQFGPSEDLSRYPRDLPRDLALLEAAGVDAAFVPTVEEIYPTGFATAVEPTGTLAARLEAARRPGHFRGVATVVAKLFQIVQPQRAYFGQKDAQQVAVIRRLIADLTFPLELRVLPTVREPDGLAMSSRNAYLGPEDRTAATVLYRALRAGRAVFDAHPRGDSTEAIDAMHAVVAGEPRAALDYADVCDPDTFEPVAVIGAPALLAIAARVGPTRLIDNFLLRADGTWDEGVRTE